MSTDRAPVPLTGAASSPAHEPGPGRLVFSPAEWRAIASALSMSEREFEIVQCVFDDLKESAIADRLGMSPHTVHTHLERLYRKLGVSGRCSLLARTFQAFRALPAPGSVPSTT